MKNSATIKSLALLNIAGFLGTIILNFLANYLPLNNKTTGEISDQYPNLFVPAGFTFSIWGVIYLLLAIFVVYQALQAFRSADPAGHSFLPEIGRLFFISCLANMTWIVAWHFGAIGFSLLIMLTLLFSLTGIYYRLQIGRSAPEAAERWMVHLPFSVYLGWITVATIANVTAVLVQWEWGRFGLSEQFWAALMILIAVGIGFMMLFRRSDFAFAAVLAWAFYGIYSKRSADPSEASQLVAMASKAAMIILIMGWIFQILRKRNFGIK
jgi:hypothetical protein